MPRYKLTLEYDGRGFFGWQKQLDRPSVQTALEAAIAAFCGTPCPVIVAGRTDTGVHATGQVAHVDLPREYREFAVMQGLNYHLSTIAAEALHAAYDGAGPADPRSHTMLFAPEHFSALIGDGQPVAMPVAIAVVQVVQVAETFHARFDALQRHYLYRITNRRARLALESGRSWHVPTPLDVAAMQEAARLLIGTHDFSTFRASECQAQSPIRTLERLDIERVGEEVRIHTSARSFLHHQVRNMVGTLVKVGQGRWSVEDVARALAAKNRAAGGPTAPPDGLYFIRVDYPDI